ncbi:hypothetical protein QBC39DRAFT_268586 [Podospora conica]|nr:hypothetical protein QBC39DRAFT_268586 [Schizothecium conicum]
MLFDSLTLAVLAASAANAFLIPPEVSSADVGIAEIMAASQAIETADTPDRRTVKFDCPGCPVIIDRPHGPKIYTPYKANHLELTFSVEHQTDGAGADKLAVNGVPIFPTSEGIPFGHQTLDWNPRGHHGGPPPWARGGPPNIPPPWAHRGGHHPGHGGPGGPPPWAFGGGRPKLEQQPLGFVMMGGEIKDAETDMELVSLSFRVLEVGQTPVAGLPEIKIQLVKDGERMVIAKLEMVEAKPECKTTLCKLMTAIFGPPSARKPCHGSAAAATPAVEEVKVKKPAVVVDEPVMRQKEHTWGQLFNSVASHILLPVLIGVVAGVAASFLGMLVGTVIVSLWRTFFRRPSERRHRRHHSRSQSQSHKAALDKEALVEEEKAGLMEDQEAPPSYEAEDSVKKTDTAA